MQRLAASPQRGLVHLHCLFAFSPFALAFIAATCLPRAFGVCLWEILLMGAIPYPGISTIDLFVMLTRDRYRMPKPGNCSSTLYQVESFSLQQERVLSTALPQVKSAMSAFLSRWPWIAGMHFQSSGRLLRLCARDWKSCFQKLTSIFSKKPPMPTSLWPCQQTYVAVVKGLRRKMGIHFFF